MKIPTTLPLNDTLPSLSQTAQQLLDTELMKEVKHLSALLCPEWLAGYMGLKKLVEKQYQSEDDPASLVIENSQTSF
ncbi:MAG TPA: hypothetical protein VGE25_13850 [Sediminibacterium sp.]|jgi:hypothetical protein